MNTRGLKDGDDAVLGSESREEEALLEAGDDIKLQCGDANYPTGDGRLAVGNRGRKGQ